MYKSNSGSNSISLPSSGGIVSAIPEDSLITNKIAKQIAESDKRQSLAYEKLLGLLTALDQGGGEIIQVMHKECRNAGQDAFLANGLGEKFFQLSYD